MVHKSYAEIFEDKYPKSIAISHRSYLEERCVNRKLYIYGTGDIAISLKQYLELNGFKTTCFIDDEYENETINGLPVINSIDIIYEEADSIFIIIAHDSESYGVSREKFLELGLIEDINFTYHTEIPGTNELFHYDVTLSFSRIRQKYQGFEVFGDETNPNAIRIVALGGSTTECSLFYVKGWVRFLVELLQEKDIPAVVYGGGVSSYTSSQELLKLIRDVIPLNPDIVISYSGVNDLYSFPSADEQNRYRRPFITRFQVQFIQQVLDRLTKEVGIPVVNAPSWNQTGHNTVFFGLQNDKTAAEFWVDNMRMMYALSQTFGIAFYSFFQPFRFNGYYKCSESQEIIHSRRDLTCVPTIEGEKRWGMRVKKELEKIRSEIKKYDFITDCSAIFENESNVFYDTTHVYEKGNKIIANKILDTIFPSIIGDKVARKYPTMESRFTMPNPPLSIKFSNKNAEIDNAIDYWSVLKEKSVENTEGCNKGGLIQFGKYKWIVLNATSDYALLLSKDIIEISNYHDSLTSITWEQCDLRKKLNTEFLNSFSDEEKRQILPALVINKNNSKYETIGGNNTVDKVFLLSIDEVEKLLVKMTDRMAEYKSHGVWWWLRTPGIYSDRAMVIHNMGHAIIPGYYIKANKPKAGAGVRPALLLNLKRK